MMQHPLDTYIIKSVFDVLLFKVGPTWGRKMVKGYMASCGITAGDKRVGRALSVVSPLYQAQRNSNTARKTNPFPYHADYFGHKLHMDQNEKLAMYGLTEVSACDGYSGKIVAFATMPVKNNVLIYEHIYRYSTITIVYKCNSITKVKNCHCSCHYKYYMTVTC